MFCDGSGSYCDMYDSSQVMVASKYGDNESITHLNLKSSLYLDHNVNYRAGHDLLLKDLEKKQLTIHSLLLANPFKF